MKPINKDTSLEELIKTFEESLQDVNTNEEFMVKDLFRGFEWNRIEKAYRTKLGSMIHAKASNGELKHIIEPTKKTPQNQQLYVKKANIKENKL